MNNKKGFTMVELLVAMAIMGLLVIMAFPTLRAVQTNNEKKKFEEYSNAVVSAAKLYVDSYGEDIFDPDRTNQFALITIDNFVKKDLLKDINVSGSSCINGESNIRLVKYGDDYAYCLHLKCFSGSSVVYETEDMKGACRVFDPNPRSNPIGVPITKVTYSYPNHKTYEVEVLKGDEDYKILNPNSIGMNFTENHDVFIKWIDKSNNHEYKPGDTYASAINNSVLLETSTRKWKYSIYFNKGIATAGTMIDNPKVCYYGVDCILPENKYSKEGYSFEGWTDGTKTYNDKENVKTSIGSKITKDGHRVDLTPRFVIKSCKVTYSPNNGKFNNHTSDITETINYGSYFGDNPVVNGMRNANGGYYDATKTGYHIDPATAWTDGTKVFDERKSYLAQNVCDLSKKSNTNTLKVNWRVNQIQVKLNANGGTFAPTYNHAYTIDSNGWISYNGNNVIHTINYGGKLTTDGLLNYDNPAYLNLVKTGYLVEKGKEWNTKADGTGKIFDETLVYNATDLCSTIGSGNCTVNLYVNWKHKTCKVTYDPNGGTFGAHANDLIQTVNYDSYFGDATDGMRNANGGYYSATKKGYHIDGATAWTNGTKFFDETKRYLAQDVCNLSTGNGSTTLKANWKLTYFTCAAGKYLAKGAVSCSNCIAGKYCKGGTFPYDTTKDQGLSPCPTGYPNSAVGSSADTQCYMNVEANKYVKNPHDTSATSCGTGTASSPHEVNYGGTSTCSGNKFTIKYNANGGTGTMGDTQCTYGFDCKLSANTFKKTNYIFAGWAKSENGAVVYNNTDNAINAVTSGTLTLYARWKSEKITLRIRMHDGEEIRDSTKSGGTTSYWGKDASGLVTRKVNGSTSVYYTQFDRGFNSKVNLANHRNPSFIFLTKKGYGADYDKAWVCEEGCKSEYLFTCYPKNLNTDDFVADDNYEGNIVVRVNWRPAKTVIMFNSNGGTATHLGGYTVADDGYIFDYKPSSYIHTIEPNGTLGSDGLLDYNDSSKLALSPPSGKSNPRSKHEWARKNNNNFAYQCNQDVYEQNKAYKATDFCDSSNGDCVCALKVNWR